MLHDLFTSGTPIAEKLVRILIIYVFLLIGLRLAGKREMGQFNPFDFVVLLVLSNTVQNSIIGDDNSLVGGIVSATALLAINWVVVRVLYAHPKVSSVVEGDPDFLIKNGQVRHESLKKALITPEELAAAAHRQGIDGLHKVATCRLEVDGELTFIPKEPTDEDRRHEELVRHLESLAKSHEKILARVEKLERL